MVHFAHLTDIHLSVNETTWSTVRHKADALFAAAIERLNGMDDLDFVLITGDVLDVATHTELFRFTRLLRDLKKPWHFVPGNHDGYIDPRRPMALRPWEAILEIDPRMADPKPDAQYAFWSRHAAPGVRLIGLDSRYADHWNGKVEPHQVAWLRDQVKAHKDETIIVTIHHPLLPLHPIDHEEFFENFICDNGDEVAALLSEHEAVRMVLHGHHHANHIQRVDGLLHIGTASLTGYPCSYRLIRLDGDEVSLRTESIADEETLAEAKDIALKSDIAEMFNADDPQAWVDFIEGQPDDLSL